jgi:hypothetical protein
VNAQSTRLLAFEPVSDLDHFVSRKTCLARAKEFVINSRSETLDRERIAKFRASEVVEHQKAARAAAKKR